MPEGVWLFQSSIPPGWHIVFIEGHVRIVNPLTGEWKAWR